MKSPLSSEKFPESRKNDEIRSRSWAPERAVPAYGERGAEKLARSSRFAGIPLLVFGLAFILVGCFGGETSSVDNSNLIAFEGSGFTMQVPKTWTAVGSKDLPKPKSGTIAGAFTSPEISSGFANNLLILRDTLADSTMNSRKYAVVNQALTTGEYLEYTKLSEAKVVFSDKDESIINTFEARYNKETPKQKFLQTSKVCGKNVYLLTIGLNLSNATTDKYAEIFKTFACK